MRPGVGGWRQGVWVEERGGRLQPNVFHCFTAGGVVRVWGGGWRQALGRVSSWSSCSHTHSHTEHRAGGGGVGGGGGGGEINYKNELFSLPYLEKHFLCFQQNLK